MSPSKIGSPVVALLSSTQHSSFAVSSITASVGVGDGVGLADGLGAVRIAVARGVARPVAAAACVPLCDDTRWYTLKPMMASRTTTTIMLRLGERRSLSFIGVDGSKTSAAEMPLGGPFSASYSLTSGTGSTPTAVAM